MDDYPAQVEMMARKSQKYTCPCLSTAQIIRAGKIMKMVADSLGRYDDIKIYDEDIEYSTKALNDLAWDEESGYFGYTEYDENGNVTGIMRTAADHISLGFLMWSRSFFLRSPSTAPATIG